MKNSLYSLCLLIFLSGCSGGISSLSSPSPKNNPLSNGLPEWIIKPESSNSSYYYAVGEGKNKDEALKNALAQISGQISVTISSDTTTSKKVTNDSYEKEVQNTIKASTDNIKFSGVSTIDTAFQNDTFYSYVKVDKNVLFDAIKKDFDMEYKQIQNKWKQVAIGDPFLLFRESKSFEGSILKSTADLSILKSIKNDFNQNQYIETLEKLRIDFKTKKNLINAYVETKDAKGEKSLIEKAISEFGIKVISNLSLGNPKNTLRIVIDKSAKRVENMTKSKKLEDVVYADVTLVITTYDFAKKNKLAKNIIEVRNGTRENYEASVIKTKKFEREIEEKGILSILLENIDS